MRRREKADSATRPQTRHLSQHLTFLDVINDCCARGGRFTLTAESADGRSYTVLVDRGGPFNASGDGLTGSDALVASARVNGGTYTVADGWPVAQPLYQVGLDATLRTLDRSSMAALAGEPPAPRAVRVPQVPAPGPAPAGLSAVEATPAAQPAAAFPVAAVPPAAAVPIAVVPPPATRPAERALVDSLLPPIAAEAKIAKAAPDLPGGPTASADQGGLKHLATQSLLWLVQIEEPERYNLKQARNITTHSIAGAVRGLLSPFRDRAKARWRQTKDDWEKSGEVVAKQQARHKKRVREVDVDPHEGPLSGR